MFLRNLIPAIALSIFMVFSVMPKSSMANQLWPGHTNNFYLELNRLCLYTACIGLMMQWSPTSNVFLSELSRDILPATDLGKEFDSTLEIISANSVSIYIPLIYGYISQYSTKPDILLKARLLCTIALVSLIMECKITEASVLPAD